MQMVKKVYVCPTCGDDTCKTRRESSRHARVCSKMAVDSNKSKKRRPTIPKAVRYAVWNSSFGERCAVGTCACCGRDVTQQSFEAGHVVPWSGGGKDTVENLRVVCRMCNGSMGPRNMIEFTSTHFSSDQNGRYTVLVPF